MGTATKPMKLGSWNVRMIRQRQEMSTIKGKFVNKGSYNLNKLSLRENTGSHGTKKIQDHVSSPNGCLTNTSTVEWMSDQYFACPMVGCPTSVRPTVYALVFFVLHDRNLPLLLWFYVFVFSFDSCVFALPTDNRLHWTRSMPQREC